MHYQFTRLAESWKPVVGYEGLYEVSSHGRVRRACAGRGSRVGKILRPRPLKNGRLRVYLSRDRRQKDVLIHHLVAAAFIGPKPSPKHEVNHKDGRPSNNRFRNLEWVTRKQNIAHAFSHGLIPFPEIRFRCRNGHINCTGTVCRPNRFTRASP